MRFIKSVWNRKGPRPAGPSLTCPARPSLRPGQCGHSFEVYAVALVILLASGPFASGQQSEIDTQESLRACSARSRSMAIALDFSNPFFQSLGTNGRSCSSCHVASSAWTITPAELQQRFSTTNGLDPIFRTVDGSNSPNADVSTVKARRKAFSMLLNKGLIRIGLPDPGGGGIRARGASTTLTASRAPPSSRSSGAPFPRRTSGSSPP